MSREEHCPSKEAGPPHEKETVSCHGRRRLLRRPRCGSPRPRPALHQPEAQMNYFATAAALRLASTNVLTRQAYWTLSKMKTGPRPVWHHREEWILANLPQRPCRLLELGTGWVHAYSLYQILLRDDEVHCF